MIVLSAKLYDIEKYNIGYTLFIARNNNLLCIKSFKEFNRKFDALKLNGYWT